MIHQHQSAVRPRSAAAPTTCPCPCPAPRSVGRLGARVPDPPSPSLLGRPCLSFHPAQRLAILAPIAMSDPSPPRRPAPPAGSRSLVVRCFADPTVVCPGAVTSGRPTARPQRRSGQRRHRPVEPDRHAGPDPPARLGDVRRHLGPRHPARPRRLAHVSPPISGYDRTRGASAWPSPRAPSGRSPLSATRPWCCPVLPGVPRAGDTPPARARGGAGARRDRPVGVHRQQGTAVPGLPDPGPAVVDPPGQALAARPAGPAGPGEHAAHASSLGIEENPVIVRHDDKWVLFTSVGWFGHCGYRTMWRRSPDLKDWSRATPKGAALGRQRPVRSRRCRRADHQGRPEPDVLPRVDLLPHAVPLPARLEQGQADEEARPAGHVRRQPGVDRRRQTAG